jgi:hypothetical protein
MITDSGSLSLSGALSVRIDGETLDGAELSALSAARRRRRIWYGAAVLGFLGLAGAGTVWAISGQSSAAVPATRPPPNTADSARDTEQEQEEAELVTVDPESLPTLPEVEPSAKPITETTPAYRPAPRPKRPKNWKQDPGF